MGEPEPCFFLLLPLGGAVVCFASIFQSSSVHACSSTLRNQWPTHPARQRSASLSFCTYGLCEQKCGCGVRPACPMPRDNEITEEARRQLGVHR